MCYFFIVMSAFLLKAKAVISVYKTPRKRCALLEQAAGRGEGRWIIATLRGERREGKDSK